jgi:hypothetical protein
MHISPEQLKIVPYVDLQALDVRRVNLMPFWDGCGWHMWVPTQAGLLDLKPVEVEHANYVANRAANDNDIIIPFVEMMWQQASWSEVCRLISGISDDFHNLGTSIEKLSYFFDHRSTIPGLSQFVKTEVEYIFVLARSVFDLLQEAISWLWGNAVLLHDPHAEAKRKQTKLPSTFAKMVLSGTEFRRPADLIDKYALPSAMAEMYASVAPFFKGIRRFRDEIVHLGKDPDMVTVSDRGFCVPNSAFGFGDSPFWKPEHQENEHCRSLLPLLAHVALGSILSCGQLMAAFAKQVKLPPAIAPRHRVFVRGPHNEALIWLLHVADGGSPWWSDRSQWRRRRIEEKAYLLWKNQKGKVWWDPVSNWLEAERVLLPAGVRVLAENR